MNTKRFFLIGTLLIVGFFGFAKGAFALTVSPARLEIDGNPGSQLKMDIVLTNDKDENQTFYSSYANFEAQGESGTPNFVENKEGLATWMSVPQTVTLTPFETKTIPLVINIPASADPGGHFSALFWSTQPGKTDNGTQVAIGAKLGILVLLRVNGEINEDGSILNFETRNGVKKYEALPVVFTYRFNNSGNDRVKPTGSIVIKNIFGMKSKVIDGNPNQGNVLPKSVRRFETAWTKGDTNYGDDAEMMPMGFWEKVSYEWKNFAFGKYNATLTLTYTSKKLVDSATTSFYVFPWHLLLVVLVVLVVIWFIFRKILMAYNRMLIAQVREKIEEEIEEKLEKKQEDHQSTKKHTRPRV